MGVPICVLMRLFFYLHRRLNLPKGHAPYFYIFRAHIAVNMAGVALSNLLKAHAVLSV